MSCICGGVVFSLGRAILPGWYVQANRPEKSKISGKLRPANMRSYIVYGLVTVWALRLSIHITIRNWGESEDHRYVTIRKNREPWFEYKSLYFVFGLQALLAWIISLPIFAAITINSELHPAIVSLLLSDNSLNL